MQNPALFLHKQVENIPFSPFHIRKNRTIYALKSASQGIYLRQCPRVRWPSDLSWMAIRLTHKWPFVPHPIAIHLLSDGHRTGIKQFFRFPSIGKPLVWGTFLACRFFVFYILNFLFSFIIQQLTSQKCIKNRVYPSNTSLARKYAILACRIYSLTKCQ